MTEIINPHDKFFKEVFTRREVAEEFLLHYLPENVVELLDLESLEYTKDSFADEALPHRGGEIMPTLADEWRKDGMQQGIQQGIQQGFLQALKGGVV